MIALFVFFGACNNQPKITLKGYFGASPAIVKIKIKTLWLSENTDCSKPRKVFDIEAPAAVDLVSVPTFGIGRVADGTYECAILKVSDQITFIPASDTGNYCKSGVATTIDILNIGSPANVCPDGIITGRGSEYDEKTEDWMCITFTTKGNTVTGRGSGFSPERPFKLSSALHVKGNLVISLSWDFGDKISDAVAPGAGHCALDPGDLSLFTESSD